MRNWLIGFFCLWCVAGWGNLKDPSVVAATEGELSSIVEGCVSAITGDFVVSEDDIVVRGIEPIPIGRSYVSGNGIGDIAGWHVNRQLTITRPIYTAFLDLNESNGTTLLYKYPEKDFKRLYLSGLKEKKFNKLEGWVQLELCRKTDAYGLTNCAKDEISGKYNLKNNVVQLRENERDIHVRCPDGGERHYNRYKKDIFSYYRLEWEKLPNGHVVHYTYHKDTSRIERIWTTNESGNKTYAWANYTYRLEKYDTNTEIRTSDGKQIHYRYRQGKVNYAAYLLDYINSSSSPHEKVHYCGETQHRGFLVTGRAFPDGRQVSVDYYSPHQSYNIQGQQFSLGDATDPRSDRVCTLKAPVGVDSNPIPIHQFIYHPGKLNKSGGSTEVYDAYGHKTHYHYSPQMRLDEAERFEGGVLKNVEKLTWGNDDGRDATNLMSRSFLDAARKLIFSRQFVYDAWGNIVEDRFEGNLTGERDGETYTKRFSHTQDGRNLLKREEEENGRVTLYEYIDGTDCLAAKFVCDGHKIRMRHFWVYNEDRLVVAEIADDGSSANRDDLSGVTERRIKRFSLRQSEPFLGMPEVVEERYLDLNTSTEVLLKKVVLEYSAQGLISRQTVYDASGIHRYTLETDYNAFGQPVREKNAIGQETLSQYDANGNKKSSKSGRIEQKMEYDFSNRLILIEEFGDDGLKRTTQNKYDFKHNKREVVDQYGQSMQHDYDAFGHVLETRMPAVCDRNGQAMVPIERHTYDAAGREESFTDVRGEKTFKTYNARAKPIQVTHPDGGIERFIYYSNGLLKTAIDQEGVSIHYAYDFLDRAVAKEIYDRDGQLVSEEKFLYDAFHLREKTDAEGTVTRFFYDHAGRKVAEEVNTDQGIERTEFFYDALGCLMQVKVCGENELITVSEYDLLDRVVEERKEDGHGKILSRVAYEYNPKSGHKECITQCIEGKETKELFFYDSFGRPSKQVDALGHVTTIVYNDDFRSALGQRVLQKTTTNAMGVQTIETFDAHGRVASVDKQNAFGELLAREEMFYNAAGHIERQISTLVAQGKTTQVIETHWDYGSLGRLITLTEAAGTDKQKVTRYTYTRRGHRDMTTKPDGILLKNDYDALGRLIESRSSDGSCHYQYVYNRVGFLLEAKDLITGQSTLRTPDRQGRVLEETLMSGLTLINRYDIQGRRRELQLPDGSSIQYDYDALYLREVRRVDASGSTSYSHRYLEFDHSGHLLTEQLIGPLGQKTARIDALGRTVKISSKHYEQSADELDELGRIKKMTITTRDGPSATHYAYDDLGQLTEEDGLFKHKFGYDSHFNRLHKNDSIYEINPLHQIERTNDAAYRFDLNGNLTRKTTASHDISYTYDAQDRLIKVEEEGAFKVVFTYDAFNRRLTKSSYTRWWCDWWEKEHLTFLYDGQNEIGAVDRDKKIIQLRVLGSTPQAEIGAAVALELNGTLLAPLHDLSGNVISLINPDTNQVVESYRYSAFGEEKLFDQYNYPLEKTSNPWRFSSKRVDDETGLVYYGRRYYDPDIGRWITPDPKGFVDGMNLYVFVLNDPLLKVDLYGLEEVARQSSMLNFFKPTIDWIGRTFTRENIGRVVNSFFFHLIPIPLLRQVGMFLGNKIGRKRFNDRESSGPLEPVGEPVAGRTTIGVNGIGASRAEAMSNRDDIAQQAGGKEVRFFHNSRHGLILDLLECGVGLLGIQTASSQKFADYIRKTISDMGGIEKVDGILLDLHSQGGIIGSNALKLLTPEERAKISVATFGSATQSFPGDLKSCQHYVASRDPVPWFNVASLFKMSFGLNDNVQFLKTREQFLEHSSKSSNYKKARRFTFNDFYKDG